MTTKSGSADDRSPAEGQPNLAQSAFPADAGGSRELLAQLPIGVAVLDRNRSVVYENSMLERTVGLSKDALASGKHSNRRYIRPDGTPMPADEFASVSAKREGRAVHDVETGVITEDGRTIWTSVSAVPIPLVSGMGILVATVDITRRKCAEEALRLSEERFRIAAETSNDVIYEWDLGQRVEWPGHVDELLGYGPGEFPRTLEGWSASVHPEDLEAAVAAIQAHLHRHEPFAVEYRIRRKDGVYRWWSARGAAARAPDGTPVRWIGSVTDITERKQAEIDSGRLAAMVESSDLCIIGKDLKGIVTSWNEGAEHLFGYSAEDMVGGSISRIIPADRQTEESYILQQTGRGERVEHFETVRQRRDGRLVDVSVTASPIKDAGGKIIGASKVARDISARKQVEAEREQLIQQLQTALEQIRTLRGIVPICASCKKIRDDRGYWQQVESYVSSHTEAQFSHGICPECMDKLYPNAASNHPGGAQHDREPL